MNTGEKITLTDIFCIKNYQVQIPIIQRDYAQGRDSKKSIRKQFLDVLYDTLKNEKAINLDFVYGYVNDNKFIPLDGQQRLTTLFLLHYFLALKEDKFDSFSKIFSNNNASKFTYETRHSSKSFFNNLVLNGRVELSKEKLISEIIKDQKWYFYEWENDPTVAGVLAMLDAIEDKFKDDDFFYDKLIDHRLITFEFLNLEEYNLSDDLYIKMNARGKVLTPFENFKARFEGIIEKIDVSLKNDFVHAVDTTWCDLFWSFSKGKNTEKPIIDDLFLNYFHFISEFLFYADESKAADFEYTFEDFEIIKLIYSDKRNLEFLINSLHLLASSKDNVEEIDTFFKELLTSEVDKRKVNIFDNECNLLTKLIFNYNSITHLDRFILYSIIQYHLELNHKKLIFEENLLEIVRFVRNFVVDINQKGNDNSRDLVLPNIRFSNYTEIVDFINKIIKENAFENFEKNIKKSGYRKDFVAREIEKVNFIKANLKYKDSIRLLENHPNLKGNLSSFKLVLESNLNLDKVANKFLEIWNEVETEDIIRCLLCYGDYAVHVGNCNFGGLWYFGNEGKWERIYNYANENLNVILLNFFTDIIDSTEISINKTIAKILKHKDIDEEWRYLFVKYPKVLVSNTNIYSFREHEAYKIDALDRYTLKGYHINIYIHEVLNNDKLLCKSKIKNNGWEVDSNESVIALKYSDYMTPVNEGWFISSNNLNTKSALTDLKYEEAKNGGVMLLRSKKYDIIEVAIIFLNNYYNTTS